jgi:hypothetical protein
LRQLTCIEPVPAAIGALVDLDAAFRAEEMPMEFDLGTPRAFALARRVNHNAFGPAYPKQRLACPLIFFVDLLQFKRVKPDAAAPVLAYIDHQLSDLHLREIIEARWTFHILTLARILKFENVRSDYQAGEIQSNYG